MKKYVSQNIMDPIIGVISLYPFEDINCNSIVLSHQIDDIPEVDLNYKALIIVNEEIPISSKSTKIPTFFFPNLSNIYLDSGDVISINPEGNLDILFRNKSKHNVIFATGMCNCNCLMCPQPPIRNNDIQYWYKINNQLIELIPKETELLGITGGEPTLLGCKLINLLKKIRLHLPTTKVDLLTNGKTFSKIDNAKMLSELKYQNLLFAVSLHSDYYLLHDFIAQSKDSFVQTTQGIYNLAKYNQRIELRIVLSKQSVMRLKNLSVFILKNMPFVEHIAFMGMEYIGYAPINDTTLWIDPVEYIDELSDAIELLSINGMNVSIYNLQLCLLPPHLWKYSRHSISDWKNIYFRQCSECSMVSNCGGFFESSKNKHSNYIRPIL